MQWKHDWFIKCRAASSAKLACTLQRWSISFKGRQAVTADRLCFYRQDTFKRNKTLGQPGWIMSWCGIGKSAVDDGSFPLTPKIQFQVLQNCRFSASLFSYFLCGIPGWALLFGMEQKATVEQAGTLLDCRSFLQDEWLQRCTPLSQSAPGFR